MASPPERRQDEAIAAVADAISTSQAEKVVNVSGLYVVPGLIDLHVHVFAGTNEERSYAGDLSLYPDGFTFRSCADLHGSGRKR
jgi:dihydroorotase